MGWGSCSVPDVTIKRAVKLAIKGEGSVLLRLSGIDMQQVHGKLTHPISYLSEPAYPTLSANNHSNIHQSKAFNSTSAGTKILIFCLFVYLMLRTEKDSKATEGFISLE